MSLLILDYFCYYEVQFIRWHVMWWNGSYNICFLLFQSNLEMQQDSRTLLTWEIIFFPLKTYDKSEHVMIKLHMNYHDFI